MNKKKLIAAVICLVLVITAALPGTLAVSADAASSDGTISVATPETTQTPDDSVVTDDAAPQSESETPAEPKTCTCDPAPAEGEAHKEGCPLYVAPEKPAEEPKTCTCDPAPAEGEAHKEGCPLYVAPELDIAELYSRLMAMQTQEEIVLVLMELSPETIAEFTDEQAAAIEAHYDSLSTTAAVSGDTMTPGDETVVGSSEVRYLTYDFTYAAPFKDPVEGGN